MSNLDQLEQAWRDAEARAVKLQNDKDEALQKVRDRFADRQRAAVDEAAAAQKAWLDASAAQALADRDDLDEQAKQTLADNLGLTLPG